MMMTFVSKARTAPRRDLAAFLVAVVLLLPAALATAQPINDSLKALTLRNEKMYRLLGSMEDKGASYEFTNVIAWKITDEDLKNQIIKIYTAQYGEKQLKNFDIQNVYMFSAPVNSDRVEPFHILFMGKRVNVDTSGGGEDGFFGGGKRRRNSNDLIPVAFKGREVITTMRRQPALLDNINAVQGEIVELPGELAPRGVQIVKNSTERYVFHQMFTGFYSKRQIIDEQNRAMGAPTIDEETAVDSTRPVIPTEPDESTSLPEEVIGSRAFRYEKIADISIDHLGINLSRQNELEIQIGNPEVGLPFWASGENRLWFNMRNQIGTESDFKIGLDFPLDIGRSDWLTFPARKMSGFWGGSIDAYFSGIDFFSAFNMPIAFNFSVLPSAGYNSSIIYSGVSGAALNGQMVDGSRTFLHTTFIGQLYIPFIVQLDPANFVQFSAGVGVHTVKLSFIPGDSEAVQFGYGANASGKSQDLTWNGKATVSTPFTPHVAIQYVNHRSNKFGLNFQYDHLFTFGAWLELIPDHLRIEGNYTAPLVRDAKPYEQPYFFEITPRLYF